MNSNRIAIVSTFGIFAVLASAMLSMPTTAHAANDYGVDGQVLDRGKFPRTGIANNNQPKFEFKTIPVTGCVLRPTKNQEVAALDCTPVKGAIESCTAGKGEVGSIDGQLYCRRPFNIGPKLPAGARRPPPVYPNDYPDEAAQARFLRLTAAAPVRN